MKVFQDIGRIRHSDSEHTVSREVFGKFFQELRYVGIDISPIGSRILRGEPDLSNSLTDS